MAETVVRMPKLADTLVEGTVGRWLKRLGDKVRPGEPLASIETDKVTTDLTSPAAGWIAELLVVEGTTVPVETPIARIAAEADADVGSKPHSGAEGAAERGPNGGAEAGARQPPPAAVQASGEPSRGASRGASQTPPQASRASQMTRKASRAPQTAAEASRQPSEASREAPKPTPVAARILAEHGLQPEDVDSDTRRITKRQVLQYIDGQLGPEPRQASPAAVQPAAVQPAAVQPAVVPLTRMRAAIADHMARAKRSIPHGQTVMRADLTDLVAWREQHKDAFQQRNEGAGLTFTVLFVAALARALTEQQLAPPGEAHIGVAVALDGGLIVPVIRGADRLDLDATAWRMSDAAQRARTNQLRPDETQHAVMTLSNVGSFGNLFAAPIIPLNQLGILGPGVVERRPLPTPQGGIRPGYACLFTLMFDRSRMTDLDADRLLRLTLELLLELPQDAHRGQHVGNA